MFAAADAVLARGERATVERGRLELDRGSPARVGTLLDQRWEQLAGCMRGETRLPELPAEVAQALSPSGSGRPRLPMAWLSSHWRASGRC